MRTSPQIGGGEPEESRREDYQGAGGSWELMALFAILIVGMLSLAKPIKLYTLNVPQASCGDGYLA